MDLETMAREYVATLNGPANAWGQHVHPVYGRSDVMLHTMTGEFGRDATHAAIDTAFKEKGAS